MACARTPTSAGSSTVQRAPRPYALPCHTPRGCAVSRIGLAAPGQIPRSQRLDSVPAANRRTAGNIDGIAGHRHRHPHRDAGDTQRNERRADMLGQPVNVNVTVV